MSYLIPKRLFLFVLLIPLSFVTLSAFASIDVYSFKDPSQELRFAQLTEELRCPKCQNNNLADSNSPLAKDLKDIIYEKMLAGETDEEITHYLKQRYGDFVSYKPPVKPFTWLIWYGPFILLLLGAFGVYRYMGGRKISLSAQNKSAISNSSQSLIDQWDSEKGDPEQPNSSSVQQKKQENDEESPSQESNS